MSVFRSVVGPGHWGFLSLCLLLQVHGQAQDFADDFAQREMLTADSGSLAGTTVGATSEPGEPRYREEGGGRSVWIAWTASANGLATFSLPSADFDTYLAIYRYDEEGSLDWDDLKRVVKDDDSGEGRTSVVQFTARSGHRYEVLVDSYDWETGSFILNWDLATSDLALPVIVANSPDVAVQLGETLTLTVDLEMPVESEVHWFFNGEELEDKEGAEESTLVIRGLEEADLGRYRLRLKVDDLDLWSEPIEVQVNSEGLVSVLARDKLVDALANGLFQPPPIEDAGGNPASVGVAGRQLRPMGPTPGIVRGYQGTQIFNAGVGAKDPREPDHCQVGSGPTYWFSYQPPEPGTLALDTEGSRFDTVLAVYTFDPPLGGYGDLQLLTCDDNSGAANSSRLDLTVQADRVYFVVVASAEERAGIAHLNYQLVAKEATNTAPMIVAQPPIATTVSPGADVTFDVTFSSALPPTVQWFKDSQPLAEATATAAALRLLNVQTQDQGDYRAVVVNPYGASTTSVARLVVLPAPTLEAQRESDQLILSLQSVPGMRYTLERKAQLTDAAWTKLPLSAVADSTTLRLTNLQETIEPGFYRLAAEQPEAPLTSR